MPHEAENAGIDRRGGLPWRRAMVFCAVLTLIVWASRRRLDTTTGEDSPPTAPEQSAGTSTEPDEIARQITGSVPPNVTLDRVVRLPLHVVLCGEAPDLDDVDELLERLGRIPGIGEPTLRRVTRAEHGFELAVAVPTSPAAAPQHSHGSEARPPPFATPAIASAVFRLLVPPFT